MEVILTVSDLCPKNSPGKNARKQANKRQKSGLRPLIRAVSARGINALDRRKAAFKATMRFRGELADALGGEAALSPQQMTLIDGASRVRLYLDHVDSFLLQQESLINKRSRRVIALIRDRIALADSLNRYLSLLGLARVEKDVLNAERLAEVESVLAERDPNLLPASNPKQEPQE